MAESTHPGEAGGEPKTITVEGISDGVSALTVAVSGGDESVPATSNGEENAQGVLGQPPAGRRDGAVALVYDKAMKRHEIITGSHPEAPARISRIWSLLERGGFAKRCIRIPSRPATEAELLSVHTQDHMDFMHTLPAMTNGSLSKTAAGMDSIFLNKHSHDAAYLAAGSLLALTEAVATGACKCGAAVIRPPGHHAEAHTAMGFCLFNNVAVAARQAVDVWGKKRVLVVDWDVHHGNGTQRMFLDDPNVLYFSVHRYDEGHFYPCSPDGAPSTVGTDNGAGFSVNVGWNQRRMGDAEYLAVWEHVLMPIAREFAPDLVFVSAGYDAARGDPLGGCDVSPGGYAMLTRQLMTLAEGQVVVALEGGYNLTSISESMAATVGALLGDPTPEAVDRESAPLGTDPRALVDINHTILAQQPYWPSLELVEIPVDPTPPPTPEPKEPAKAIPSAKFLMSRIRSSPLLRGECHGPEHHQMLNQVYQLMRDYSADVAALGP